MCICMGVIKRQHKGHAVQNCNHSHPALVLPPLQAHQTVPLKRANMVEIMLPKYLDLHLKILKPWQKCNYMYMNGLCVP